jgi:hypothetical protein
MYIGSQDGEAHHRTFYHPPTPMWHSVARLRPSADTPLKPGHPDDGRGGVAVLQCWDGQRHRRGGCLHQHHGQHSVVLGLCKISACIRRVRNWVWSSVSTAANPAHLAARSSLRDLKIVESIYFDALSHLPTFGVRDASCRSCNTSHVRPILASPYKPFMPLPAADASDSSNSRKLQQQGKSLQLRSASICSNLLLPPNSSKATEQSLVESGPWIFSCRVLVKAERGQKRSMIPEIFMCVQVTDCCAA